MRRWLLCTVFLACGSPRPTWQRLRPGPQGYAIRPVREWPPLWAHSWQPAGDTRAVVVLVHDHGGDGADAFAGLGRHLAANGFAVHTFDWRGTGRSGGWREPGEVDVNLRDLAWFVNKVRRVDAPLFLLADGTAGVLATLYAAEPAHALAGLILASPAVEAYAPFWEALERLRAPLLLLHGKRDRHTLPLGSTEVFAFVPVPDKTIRLYEKAGHDLWDDSQVDAVTDLNDWLAAHVGEGAHAPASSEIPVAYKPSHRPRSVSFTWLAVGAGAYLAARAHSGRAWTRSSGWDAGATIGFGPDRPTRVPYQLQLFPIGGGRRFGRDSILYVMGGAGLSGIAGDVAPGFELPLFASLEVHLGWWRLISWARVARILGDPRRQDPETGAGLAVRLGRNRRIWPGTTIGERWMLGGFVQEFGDVSVLGLVVGTHFWGAN